MRIVVNHLTRMKPGFICVAGINLDTRAHVRPVLSSERLTTSMLRRAGGPFDIAAVVDLGTTQPSGSPPETEDYVFDPAHVLVARTLPPKEFWDALTVVAKTALAGIFGPDLKARGKGCAVKVGCGTASLGYLQPPTLPRISINGWGKIRAKVIDGVFSVDLSVTDLRLYNRDHQTPRARVVSEIQRRIERGVSVILSVGLARAFQAKGDTVQRHWLQVNNVHLEDDPSWQAG